MDTVTLIAIIAGVSGFVTSIGSIVVPLIKHRTEKLKDASDAQVDATVAAGNIITSASKLTEMYEKSLQDCKDQITSLENRIITLQNQVDELQKTILCKEKENLLLIARLIKGINILIEQLRKNGIEPAWIPNKSDIAIVK